MILFNKILIVTPERYGQITDKNLLSWHYQNNKILSVYVYNEKCEKVQCVYNNTKDLIGMILSKNIFKKIYKPNYGNSTVVVNSFFTTDDYVLRDRYSLFDYLDIYGVILNKKIEYFDRFDGEWSVITKREMAEKYDLENI